MKKIILFIILFFTLFFQNFFYNFACSIPPDILNRYYIYEENWKLKVNYSLYTWENFKIKIEDFFEKNNHKKLNEENINIFIQEYIKNISSLTLNWKNLELNFESVKFYEDIWAWDPMFEIKFSTNIEKLQKENNFYLIYKKNTFSQLSNLVHAYLYTAIEEDLNIDWYTTFWEERYDNYLFDWGKYAILSKIENELWDLIEYKLNIKKIEENIENSKIENKNKEKENPFLIKNSNFKINGFNLTNYFQSFLNKDLSIFMKIFGIIFAIIFWALHSLLPGHAKSIVWAYIIEEKNSKSKKLEIFILILSITFTHTIFIFLIAFFVNLLNFGVGQSTTYVHIFWSILYIIFWLYFIYYSIKNILPQKKHTHTSCNCWHHNHSKEKNTIKKSILAWFIFGCIPCIDALILFIFALSIWNIFYSILIIIAFSLWLGIMLGIIAFFVWKWKNILQNKNSNKIKNILNYLIFFMWLYIIYIWFLGL